MLPNPASSAPLRLPTGQQVYDALMGGIEKELLAGNVPNIDAPYGGETPERRQERYAGYQDAFGKYDKAFAALASQLRKAVDACRSREGAQQPVNQTPEAEPQRIVPDAARA